MNSLLIEALSIVQLRLPAIRPRLHMHPCILASAHTSFIDTSRETIGCSAGRKWRRVRCSRLQIHGRCRSDADLPHQVHRALVSSRPPISEASDAHAKGCPVRVEAQVALLHLHLPISAVALPSPRRSSTARTYRCTSSADRVLSTMISPAILPAAHAACSAALFHYSHKFVNISLGLLLSALHTLKSKKKSNAR